jgi:hypothetical protein
MIFSNNNFKETQGRESYAEKLCLCDHTDFTVDIFVAGVLFVFGI